MKLENQAAFHNSCRNMASWLLILVGMPRTLPRDEGESRLVQLVGMPMGAQHVFTTWANEHHPAAIMAARDDDGMLRSVSENLYHMWLTSLFVSTGGEEA